MVIQTHTTFLVNDQRDAQIILYVFISIYNSLHVSSTQCSSSGETNCVNTASGNSQLMLYREIIAVCSEIHTKHINTLSGQNVELLNVKLSGKHGNHNDFIR
jgi:hypothetical protein